MGQSRITAATLLVTLSGLDPDFEMDPAGGFQPHALMGAWGVGTDAEGNRFKADFGQALTELEAQGYVDWKVDPVSATKQWQVTEAGLAQAHELKRQAA